MLRLSLINIELVDSGKQKKLLYVNRGRCLDWFVQVPEVVEGYQC